MTVRKKTLLYIILFSVIAFSTNILIFPNGRAASNDAYENNDTIDSAWLLAKGFHSEINLSSGDVDYFRVNLAAGENLSVVLTRIDGNGGFAVDIYGSDKVTRLQNGEVWFIGYAYIELSVKKVNDTGFYYIKVAQPSGGGGNYTINVMVEVATNRGGDDSDFPWFLWVVF